MEREGSSRADSKIRLQLLDLVYQMLNYIININFKQVGQLTSEYFAKLKRFEKKSTKIFNQTAA